MLRCFLEVSLWNIALVFGARGNLLSDTSEELCYTTMTNSAPVPGRKIIYFSRWLQNCAIASLWNSTLVLGTKDNLFLDASVKLCNTMMKQYSFPAMAHDLVSVRRMICWLGLLPRRNGNDRTSSKATNFKSVCISNEGHEPSKQRRAGFRLGSVFIKASWVDCHQNEPLVGGQQVEPVHGYS